MSSVKTNYILNLVNTISGMLFPLLTFPYASRIMQADGIGQVNFYGSIISYVSLLTCLGIPMYAIRETARIRDNEKELNKTTVEILLLHTGLTVIGYLIVAILCLTVKEIRTDIPLFLVMSSNILFVAIGCEWFYQGMENFKYITIRGLVVKAISVVLLFLLVKTKDDLLLYGIYTVVGAVGGNIFNFVRLRKYIKPRLLQLKELHPLRHLKPALHIFVLNLVVSIYLNLDTVMLGFLKNTAAVGYYTGATKLTKMLLGIVNSLGTVMIPRLSNLIRNHQEEEFHRLSQKAVDFVVMLSIPLCLGLIILSAPLIHLFCGPSYEPAIMTLNIISPILLIIALSNVMGMQILFPQGKENFVIMATAIGAVVNFTLNYILIPKYAQDGAAVATVCAEFCVTLSMAFIGRRYLHVTFLSKHVLFCILSALMMFAIGWYLHSIIASNIIQICLIPFTCAVTYGLSLWLLKDKFIMDIINENILKRIK